MNSVPSTSQFSPSSIENSLNTSSANNFHELEQTIKVFVQTQFTGCLDLTVEGVNRFQGSLFFKLGRLLGGDCNVHPIRRWGRQFLRHCPHFKYASVKQTAQFQPWKQNLLIELKNQGRITSDQFVAIAQDNLVEILFDTYQAAQLSNTAVQLACRSLPENLLPATVPLIPVSQVYQQVQQLWQAWQESQLMEWSPNLAPVIWDAEELRRQMSFLAYHNLTMLIDSDRTLRDIAVQLKQPLVPLTRSLLPYIQGGIIGLTEVKDWSSTRLLSFNQRDISQFPIPNSPGTVAPTSTRSTRPLIAYIEDSRFDSIAMSQIIAQAGYRFINVGDPIEALPILLEQKPSLIFLDLLMPVTNGYEVCAQIRRISTFKDTPVIIVTSKDGIVDRVRAKLVGSSDFIAKPIEAEKVLSVLGTYLTAR